MSRESSNCGGERSSTYRDRRTPATRIENYWEEGDENLEEKEWLCFGFLRLKFFFFVN